MGVYYLLKVENGGSRAVEARLPLRGSVLLYLFDVLTGDCVGRVNTAELSEMEPLNEMEVLAWVSK